MKDARPSSRDLERHGGQNSRKIVGGGLVIAAIALTVIVGPHFLKTSPTTNENTDPTNGVGAANPPSCPAPAGDDAWLSLQPRPDGWHPTGSVADATAGVVCYQPGAEGSTRFPRTEGVLSSAQLEALAADIDKRLTADAARPGRCGDPGSSLLLVLSNESGDTFTLADVSCTQEFASALGYWVPSSAASAVIESALGGRSAG